MFGRKSLAAINKQEPVSGAHESHVFVTSGKVALGPHQILVVMYEEGRVPQLHADFL
jgi:hypothetical protein